MKAVTARLDWSLMVDCPHCDESMDVAGWDAEHADYVATKHIFNNEWDAIKGYEVTCEHCGKEFEISEVEY